MSENLSPFEQRLRDNGREDTAILGGVYSAGFYVALPAIPALAIMAVFGEGRYILPLLAVMYVALLVYGIQTRRSAQSGTARRTRGLWIAIYSFFLAAACGLGSLDLVL